MTDRTALLPAFVPADYLAALDLLDPVAPVPPTTWRESIDREWRLAQYRARCARDDRRVEMVRRAGR